MALRQNHWAWDVMGFSAEIQLAYEVLVFILTMYLFSLACGPLVASRKSKRRPTRKERTLLWLVAQIWALKGSGLQKLKSKERLIKKAAKPLCGSGSGGSSKMGLKLRDGSDEDDDLSTSAGSWSRQSSDMSTTSDQ
mmetsp:Transcript_127995/g.226772  ORF Transcript_127995/g.226772 Transcript_127995/m.226772 type:complete len:137 (-) Transcript_127995:159-569(-)